MTAPITLTCGAGRPLDSYYLISLLLPGAPDLAAGLLRNFLAYQDESGAVDWKLGLAGQRSRQLAQPLLATLALQIAPYMPQPDWYREVSPACCAFSSAGFAPRAIRTRMVSRVGKPGPVRLEDSPSL